MFKPNRKLFVILISIATSCWGVEVSAQEPPQLEEAAAALQASVVTVRVQLTPQQPQTKVTVCSGVCVRKGVIVTPAFAASDSIIRVTFPGGEQGQAQLRVIDEYCGLSLLKLNTDSDVPPLELAQKRPVVGAWIMSGAGWGIEKPVISLGIVSGLDRDLAGVAFPPLLQCSMPTAKTSSGAAIVNTKGQLVGVVVVADKRDNGPGWSYAVEVDHVRRLLRSAPSEGTKVVVLKRRRPVVGMVLGGQEGKIEVKRVTKDSPADKAGVKVGDRVLEADGFRIRSVYQAVRPVLKRQPGDSVKFVLQNDEGAREVEIVLEGGMVLPSAPFAQLGQYILPKVDIDGNRARLLAGDPAAVKRDPFLKSNDEKEAPARPTTDTEKIKLLQRAVDSYLKVIEHQQRQLEARKAAQQEADDALEKLKSEVESLRTKIEGMSDTMSDTEPENDNS